MAEAEGRAPPLLPPRPGEPQLPPRPGEPQLPPRPGEPGAAAGGEPAEPAEPAPLSKRDRVVLELSGADLLPVVDDGECFMKPMTLGTGSNSGTATLLTLGITARLCQHRPPAPFELVAVIFTGE